MVVQDPSRRLMNEFRTIALDLAGRMSGIEAAMRLNSSLFNRDTVSAVRAFAKEGVLQRGGTVFSQVSNANPQQIADDLATSLSRVAALALKLRRGRFSRDSLLLAGLSIGAAASSD